MNPFSYLMLADIECHCQGTTCYLHGLGVKLTLLGKEFDFVKHFCATDYLQNVAPKLTNVHFKLKPNAQTLITDSECMQDVAHLLLKNFKEDNTYYQLLIESWNLDI